MKNVLTSLVLTAALVGGFLFYFSSDHGAWLREKLSGGHELVPVMGEEGDIEYWTCTMHPSVKMKEPGKCPICAMDLVPVKKVPPASQSSSAATNSDMTSMDVTSSNSVFNVDPRRQQLLNVNTTPVEVRPLQKSIRTVAILELDETRIEHVRTKIKGWVDQTFVNYEFQHVKKSDPLLSIYSPELVATQEEYLLALRTAEELSASPFEHVAEGSRSLLRAARRRLELYDISEEQIRHLQKTGEVRKYLTIYSPFTGHVTERNAFPNMYVTPETNLYTIADHTRIWAQVEIYENDIPFVWQGQAVRMTTEAYPGQVFSGKVAYVYPHVMEKTRTLRVRLEFPNSALKLKPKMYGSVEILVPLGKHLAIPESAVLRTGKRDLVFVDLGGGQMQLRQVEVGAKAGGFYQILKGLKAGERVVTAANFLIDAESKVQGVEATWETPKPR